MSFSGTPPARSPKPNLPLKTRLLLTLYSALTNASRRTDGTINRRLSSLVELRAGPNPNSIRGVRTLDLSVDPARNLWIRLFLPSPDPAAGVCRSLPLVVFFHGGGFAYLSADSRFYDLVCRRIAGKVPAVIVSVNYRLSPEHNHPAQYDDGSDVLRFIESGGIDAVVSDLANPAEIFLAGDSAGANIAHHVALRWAADGDSWKKVRLLGLVLIQPFFGGEERTESEIRFAGVPLASALRTDWMWRAFLPAGTDRDHEAANVLGPKDGKELGDIFPPAMVVIGGYDPLQDWQRRYCERLRARGKEVRTLEFPEAIHGFYIFPEMADGEKLIEEMRKFVQSHRSPEQAK